MSSAKECYLAHNTLACVIKMAEGHVTTIELKSDAFVTGLLDHVDGFMNVSMRETVYEDGVGRRYRFEQFFVPNRVIRFVQIPPTIDIRRGLKEKSKDGSEKKESKKKIDRGRQKILEKKQARQREDVANAMKWMREKQGNNDHKNKD